MLHCGVYPEELSQLMLQCNVIMKLRHPPNPRNFLSPPHRAGGLFRGTEGKANTSALDPSALITSIRYVGDAGKMILSYLSHQGKIIIKIK
jgi:hypothetical protein